MCQHAAHSIILCTDNNRGLGTSGLLGMQESVTGSENGFKEAKGPYLRNIFDVLGRLQKNIRLCTSWMDSEFSALYCLAACNVGFLQCGLD